MKVEQPGYSVGIACIQAGLESGPEETRTRDLRHARAVMFAPGGALLLMVGERIRYWYGDCGKYCARLYAVVSGWILAALRGGEVERCVVLLCGPRGPESMVVSGAVVSCGGGKFTVEVPHCPLYPSPSHPRCDARQGGWCRSWGRCTEKKLPRRGSTRT
jgi:hypothetical protein